MASGLRQRGLSAPQILTPISTDGLLIIEDLGDERVVDRRSAGADRGRATRPPSTCWSRCTAQELPSALPVAPHVDYSPPAPTTSTPFMIEAELLLDWYLPRLGAAVPTQVRAELRRALARGAAAGDRRARRPGCCAIIIRPICSGCRSATDIARVGLLDFQDAVIGPGRLRRRLAAAGRARRRAGSDGGRAARPLRPRAAARSTPISTPAASSGSTPRSRRSAPRRFSASSPGSTGATASRNICVTCRGYGAICSARWRIRRWRRCKAWYAANVPAPRAL